MFLSKLENYSARVIDLYILKFVLYPIHVSFLCILYFKLKKRT